MLDVVERDDLVENAEPHVRQPDRVGVLRGQPLEPAHGVVAHVADRPARERRNVLSRRNAGALELAKRGERVAARARDLRPRRGAQERPPRHAVAALHGLEEEARLAL